MTEELKKAKSDLIKMFCEEIKNVIATKQKVNYHYKIGWVDYITDALVQHEFVGIYILREDTLMLLESNESKSDTNLRIDEVTDIEKLEWILKGLHEHNKDITNDA